MNKPLVNSTEDGDVPAIPRLEDFFGKLGLDGGWENMLKSPAGSALQSALAEKRVELQKDYASVFGTPAGQRVLEDLLDRSWRRACVPPSGTNSLEQLTPYVLERNGQNSTVFYILKMVDQASKAGAPKTKKKAA